MCGISGYLSTHPEVIPQSTLIGLKSSIAYRGRDGEGEWTDGKVVHLFHSRLSIIDLETGDQPMKDVDDQLVIVFNGEIYNYVELRARYEALGARFRTQSDTEVVLEGYKRRGAAVVPDLIGMFAFAIWDKARNELFLARDRLGKKPLYWTALGGSFFFSSTLDAFSRIPEWNGELSRIGLDFYTAVGSFPIGRTAFKQARSLPSGATATVRPGRPPVIDRYWRHSFARKRRGLSLDSALAEYEDLLTDALRIRLRADVPIALTFSGGVDSGTLASVAAKRLGAHLSCFTIDYHTEDDPSEEVIIARRVANDLGLPWHFVQFNYHDELLSALDDALTVVDQPCSHIAISYSQRLYETIRPFAKVVLTGNGADELFLGYVGNETLVRPEDPVAGGVRARMRQLLRRIRRGELNVGRRIASEQCDFVRAKLGSYRDDVSAEELVRELREEIQSAQIESRADLYTFMAIGYYTCDANFRLPDIAGLRAQVEVRSPFLDHRMVEFAARLPNELKIGNFADPTLNKLLPKEYYRRHVTPDVAFARKKGMGWNLRYGESFVRDPSFRRAFEEGIQEMRTAGLDPSRICAAWKTYVREKSASVQYPSSAGEMASGFMLGRWLTTRGLREGSNPTESASGSASAQAARRSARNGRP